jgi:branched-chain amino acid transport system substrate-binding protein
MKNRKSFVVCCFLLVLIMATTIILGCTPQSGSIEKPVDNTSSSTEAENILKIGALFSITGTFSVREVPDYNQTVIMAEIINENGGVTVDGKQYKIEIVEEDCKTTMDGVTAAATKLVYDEGIKFIIGPTAFFAAAASPICDSNKVLRCITWGVHTPGELDETTPYSFLASNASVIEATGFVEFIKEYYPDVKKVALVTVDDGGVPYVVPLTQEVLNRNGIEVVGDVIAYPNDMQDMSPVVAKINALKEADAVFQQNGLGPNFGGIVKGLREVGFNKPIFGSLPTLLNEVIAIAGKDAVKDVVTNAVTPTDPNLPDIAKEVISRTYAEYGEDYPLLLTGADSLWVLTQAIEKANSLDPEKVKAAWEASDTLDTIFGPACVSGDETFGQPHHVVPPPQGMQYLDEDGNIAGFLINVGCIP